MKSCELLDDFEKLNDLSEEIEESFFVKDLAERMNRILDADHHKANINEVTAEAVCLMPEEPK